MNQNSTELLKMATDDLLYAVTCLGKEGSVDFLDSLNDERGPNILDYYINVNETEFLSYEQYEALHPVQLPPKDEYGALFYAAPPISRRRYDRWFDTISQQSLSGTLHLSVFGTHATLSMEPVHMLREFVITNRDVDPVYYGLEPRWCGILGMCNRGDGAFAKFYKDAEQDPYGDDFSWDMMEAQIAGVYQRDEKLRQSEMLMCTEPLVGCLLLQKLFRQKDRRLPVIGYLGVALLNSVPPFDVKRFWNLLDDRKPFEDTVLYVNNRILREQIYYQSGIRAPYVRAHGLYTNSVWTRQMDAVLFWRAPLYVYPTLRCALWKFLEQMKNGVPKDELIFPSDSSVASDSSTETISPTNPLPTDESTKEDYPFTLRFLDEGESMKYEVVAQYRSIILLPWDHALLTFYELYSMGMPLFLPKVEWIYRFVYQRGQLSVGEPLYQSIHPDWARPKVLFEEQGSGRKKDGKEPNVGPMSPATGLSSAKAARGVAEDMLTRGLAPNLSLDEVKSYMVAALDLVKDQQFFLTAAENKTFTEDSYTSAGKIKRWSSANENLISEDNKKYSNETWHPYSPFQMSPIDSNDFTRMRYARILNEFIVVKKRLLVFKFQISNNIVLTTKFDIFIKIKIILRKGSWWFRRGLRSDAMRYWFQYSDFYRFPALHYFNSIPDLFCKLRSADLKWTTNAMRKYNDETLIDSIEYWTDAVIRLSTADLQSESDDSTMS